MFLNMFLLDWLLLIYSIKFGVVFFRVIIVSSFFIIIFLFMFCLVLYMKLELIGILLYIMLEKK